jgi:hypothetical protein
MIEDADYPSEVKKFLKITKACCVYIVSASEAGPVKVGIAHRPWERFSAIQSGNWLPLCLPWLLWCPGDEAAYRIEQKTHEDLHGRNIRGEWFDMSASEPEMAIMLNASMLYPSVSFFLHAEMIKKGVEALKNYEDRKIFKSKTLVKNAYAG